MSERIEMPSDAFLRLYKDSKKFRQQWGRDSLYMAIAIQIREIRRQRGWSQAELGKRAGMAQSRIAVLESGVYQNLGVKTLSRIAAAFDCALRVEFVSHKDFIKWIFTITAHGVELVKSFADDLAFLKSPACQERKP